MMPRDRADRVLDEFSAVTNAAPRPESPAHRVTARQPFPMATLTGASLIVVTLAVAALVFGRSGPIPAVGASPSAPAASAVSVGPLASPPAASAPVASAPVETPPAATPVPTSAPTPTPPAETPPAATPTANAVATCDPANLVARITLWEGAAGSRIAHVEVTNSGTTKCLLETTERASLFDGNGTVLIRGTTPATVQELTLPAGATATTLVETSNYCGPDPVAPVTVHFRMSTGDQFVASPVDPTDATVPPCNGAAQPASIDMHPWAR
jgi:hypothetical protein